MPNLNSGNWDPALHPRDSIGEFRYNGGRHRSKNPIHANASSESALQNALSKLTIDRTYKDPNDGKANPHGIYITHYGPSPKVGGWDSPGDSQTDRGIGNHNNLLNSLSLAISDDIAKTANLSLGGPVYVNSQYIGNYDDRPGRNENGRIDIYDYNNRVGKNWGGIVWAGKVTNHP